MSADAPAATPQAQCLAPGHRRTKAASRRSPAKSPRSSQRRRSRHALGRSGRRQDDACARPDPATLRRSGAGGAEPDLHADADLRRRHFPIVHADLYRVQSPDELAELGWDEAAEGALVLVEWADRMGDTIAARPARRRHAARRQPRRDLSRGRAHRARRLRRTAAARPRARRTCSARPAGARRRARSCWATPRCAPTSACRSRTANAPS